MDLCLYSGTPIASIVGENCTGDYVIIPSPMQGGITLPYDRFCGNGLPTVTCKYLRLIYFRFCY